MSHATLALPVYADEVLEGYGTPDLLQLLIRNEDRVPQNVIDECARRGDEMVERLAGLPQKDYYWGDDQTPGEWWLLLHAVMILGLIPGERAGELLVSFMRRMDEAEDDTLQEWLSGHWPALFRNKPDSVIPALRALAEDRARGWYVRVDAVDAAIASAQARGAEPLDQALAWAAGLAFSENEDFDVRVMAGNTLLNFARPEFRAQLELLADLQPSMWRLFDRGTIDRIYAAGKHELEWEGVGEPWAFYTPEAIEKRQRDRTEVEARFAADEDAATSSLPRYPDESLAGYSAAELLQLLVRDQDRVRRNAIDECARRGDEMVDSLSRVLDDERYWTAETAEGEWWLPVHAVMILGLMPGERAGSLLAGFARRLAEGGDDLLQGWVAGTWHALFRNKPAAVMHELREMAQDEKLDAEFRADTAKAHVKLAMGLGGAALEDALRWIAGIAFDESADAAVRHSMGNILVDFPRPEYRSGLEALAREDSDTFQFFYEEDIEQAYTPPLQDDPTWEIDDDPWSFYTPNAIVERQDRWEGRHARSNSAGFADPPGEQYVRAGPKVGRNDPCPCGSGKKYKKCCLK